jgi:hypothetical protein
MKCLLKNWKIGAYFGSIVLAVGIGMASTTVGEGMTGSAANCKHYVLSDQCPTSHTCGTYNKCITKNSGGGADSCNSAISTRCFNSGIPRCNDLNNQMDHAGLVYQECNANTSE